MEFNNIEAFVSEDNPQLDPTRKTAVALKDVGIMFNLNPDRVDNFKEFFISGIKNIFRSKEDKLKRKNDDFWALRHIGFEVKKGERLGILGVNGAGKSTMLKIISGVYKPTEGEFKVSGVIAPLLELGAGFDGQYTGAENIFLYGATLGYSREYIAERYDEIVEFSELKEFINVPLKNYSSGMKSRLGFAIATAVDPDILILDEVLSVGDAKFRKKSEAKVVSMFEKGVTVLFVSHNTAQVRRICDNAIMLKKSKETDPATGEEYSYGSLVAYGPADAVCDLYEHEMGLGTNKGSKGIHDDVCAAIKNNSKTLDELMKRAENGTDKDRELLEDVKKKFASSPFSKLGDE